ncbi:beta-1,3-galactosyltransferase 5 [Lingula anatina]|uniref:Hexosyltransferase n=1 Tax=Lingula anatina TaxID=7574 RepID=A0A1S3H1Q7_LINAN|nr:beta-1,3-galactosyltransferase 5 [Lingula anatina]|eukprot:XP_013379416.1 beta-1,3-galactosyltransferase 5 [Lingula anatina]
MRSGQLKNICYVTILLPFVIVIITNLAICRNQDGKSELSQRVKPSPEHLRMGTDVGIRRVLSHEWKHTKEFLHRESYNFTINNPEVCHTTGRLHDGVFLLVIVVTTPQNFVQRLQFRQTWGSRTQFKDEQIRTLFLTGRGPNSTMQYKLKAENDKYEDIIQADFEDRYLNLTLKTILALRWTLQYCPKALYLLKSDDDMIVSYEKLSEYLYSLPWKQVPRLHMGTLLVNKPPFRSKHHKWYTSYDEWPEKHFPPYISGAAYVLGHSTVKELYSAAMETPLFKFEDVFMGICARKANLTLSHNHDLPDFRMGDHYSYCLYDGYITIHHAASNLRWRYWKQLRSSQRPNCTVTGWKVFDYCSNIESSDPTYSVHGCETIQNW